MKVLFTKKELIKIRDLLKANDYESQILGYSCYQNSGFRKYIRNKCFAFKKEPKRYFQFPLNGLLFANKKYPDYDKRKNEEKISRVLSVINAYLANKIIIYDYSYFKRSRKK